MPRFGQVGVLPVTLITSFHSIILLTLATSMIGARHRFPAAHFPSARCRGRLFGAAQEPAAAGDPASASSPASFSPGMPRSSSTASTELLAGAAGRRASLFCPGGDDDDVPHFRRSGAGAFVLVIMKMLIHPLVVWLLASEIFAAGRRSRSRWRRSLPRCRRGAKRLHPGGALRCLCRAGGDIACSSRRAPVGRDGGLAPRALRCKFLKSSR